MTMKTAILVMALLAIAPLTLYSQISKPHHHWDELPNTPLNTRTSPVPQPVLESHPRYNLRSVEVKVVDKRGGIIQTATLPFDPSSLDLKSLVNGLRLPGGEYWLVFRRDGNSRTVWVRKP